MLGILYATLIDKKCRNSADFSLEKYFSHSLVDGQQRDASVVRYVMPISVPLLPISVPLLPNRVPLLPNRVPQIKCNMLNYIVYFKYRSLSKIHYYPVRINNEFLHCFA